MQQTRRQFLELAGIGLTSSLEMGGLPNPMMGDPLAYVPEIPSITDYGAVSGQDCTQAFQDAIADLMGGGLLYIPPGLYDIAQKIIPNRPISFFGSGIKSSRVRTTFGNDDAFQVTSGGVGFDGLGFLSAVPRTAGAFVAFEPDAVQSYLRNFEMLGAFVGVRMASGATLFVERGSIRDGATGAGSCAIHVVDGNDHHINGVTIDNPTAQPEAGIKVTTIGSLQINDCNIIRAGKDLWIRGGASVQVCNSFFDTAAIGILIDSLTPVVRCKFIECWMSSHSGRGLTITQAGLVDDVVFDDCTIDFNGSDGACLNGNNIKLINSSIAGNVGSGIVMDGLLKDSFITGNRIGETLNAVGKNWGGIWNVGGGLRNVVAGNNLTGNQWGTLMGQPIINPAPYNNVV